MVCIVDHLAEAVITVDIFLVVAEAAVVPAAPRSLVFIRAISAACSYFTLSIPLIFHDQIGLQEAGT